MSFLKIENYKKNQRSNFAQEFENALSKTERMLTTKYKRVFNSGKGSRAVVILLYSSRQRLRLCHSGKQHSMGKRRRCDVAIRSLARKINLENPHVRTSNKLRKHIATVMQKYLVYLRTKPSNFRNSWVTLKKRIKTFMSK
jgi:hypothetical protein